MIKIKLTNYNIGRNENTFRTFLMYSAYFYEMGIQFVNDGSYDIEFIGMHDFINKKIPLNESIEYGLKFLENKTGEYCLFDGSDSTSLMGAYEVFIQSKAKYLFKTALTSRSQYSIPSAFNRWFFGSGSNLDLSYDISDQIFNKIKLTGWNHGYHNPNFLNFNYDLNNKDIDVCAIFQNTHNENYEHCIRNDIYYSSHRTSVLDMLKNFKSISCAIDKKPYQEFINILKRSKCAISPYGMGEICFRDFEIIQHGSVMIKPDMSLINTIPNIYIPYETYIPCKLDWSDINDVIEWVLTHPAECKDIILNAKQLVHKTFTIENLLLYWYDILKTFKNIQ